MNINYFIMLSIGFATSHASSLWRADAPPTTAERLALKQSTQAQGMQYSSGYGYQKLRRKEYARYYREYLTPRSGKNKHHPMKSFPRQEELA